VEIHPSARKHGIADEDIEHAMRHALAIDDQADDTRLYRSELVIHAIELRPKYRRLLPEG
jgi:hypothetical protein